MSHYICKVKVSNGNTHMMTKGKKVSWSGNNNKRKEKNGNQR